MDSSIIFKIEVTNDYQLSTNNLQNNMATATQTKQAIKGGEFLIRETLAQDIFIPEEFNEEQKMIMQQCKDFLAKRSHANIERD